jgi:glycerol-3-phosphate dehydrogenase
MSTRLVHTVLNRCKPPADGDIIVPVGTVAILGTTDTPVTSPTEVRPEPWEIDLLLEEASALVPGIEDHRALRAWAGIRPLYRPPHSGHSQTRDLPRSHALIDHEAEGGPSGFVTIIGGKLTTFRRMAEDVVDMVGRRLNHSALCRTAETPLQPTRPRFYSLPERLGRLSRTDRRSGEILCECELVTSEDVQEALDQHPTTDLDDLRRDLRLGMGPCQAAFCGYRAAGLMASSSGTEGMSALTRFLDERWRGTRGLAWGHGLRQLELTRRIYQDVLALNGEVGVRE